MEKSLETSELLIAAVGSSARLELSRIFSALVIICMRTTAWPFLYMQQFVPFAYKSSIWSVCEGMVEYTAALLLPWLTTDYRTELMWSLFVYCSSWSGSTTLAAV